MPDDRFERVNIDITGPFPNSHINSFILICVDPFTKWIEAFPMPKQTTLSVIHAFNYHVQCFGYPTEIHNDAGCQFTSTTFKEYCEFLGSGYHISCVRYPASNGLAERAIKSIKTVLTTKMNTAA